MFLFSFARLLKCDRFLGIPLSDPPAAKEGEGPQISHAARLELERVQEIKALDTKYGPPRTDTLKRLRPGMYPVLALLAVSCMATKMVKPPVRIHSILESAAIPLPWEAGVESDWQGYAYRQGCSRHLNPETWIDRTYVAKPPHTALPIYLSQEVITGEYSTTSRVLYGKRIPTA